MLCNVIFMGCNDKYAKEAESCVAKDGREGGVVLAEAARQRRLRGHRRTLLKRGAARQCDGVAHVTVIEKRRQQRGSAPPLIFLGLSVTASISSPPILSPSQA